MLKWKHELDDQEHDCIVLPPLKTDKSLVSVTSGASKHEKYSYSFIGWDPVD